MSTSPTDQTQQTPPAGTEQPTQPPAGTTPAPAASTAPAPAGTDLGAADDLAAAGATDLGGEETTVEETPAPNEYHGFPESGAYEEFTLPDGMTADPELAAEFTPIAKELNLSQKGAQRLLDLKAKDVQLQLKRWGEHLGTLKTTAQADPEIGGAKYQPAVQAGREVIAKFGTPAFRKMLNDYGVGAHPEMIRFMTRVRAAMGETALPQPGQGSAATGPQPLHEILYKDMK